MRGSKTIFSLLEPYENWHDISMISLNTGLRLGEILRISMCHVNFNQRLLTVVDTKSRRNRIIPLNNSAISILAKKILIKDSSEFIFHNRAPKTFSRIVKKSGLNNGVTDRVQKVVFHTLRYTFASWLVQGGVSIEVISQLLGHSSLQMTMRYAHLDPAKQSMKDVMSIDF